MRERAGNLSVRVVLSLLKQPKTSLELASELGRRKVVVHRAVARLRDDKFVQPVGVGKATRKDGSGCRPILWGLCK